MKRSLQYPEAKRILGKVSLPNAFWLCTNENLRSLGEIVQALRSVNDDVFRYHVTRDRNDFETWIRDIVLDRELARDIARVKTKETLIRKIEERANSLEKIVLRKRALEKRRKAVAKSRKASKKRVSASKKISRPKKARKVILKVAAIARR